MGKQNSGLVIDVEKSFNDSVFIPSGDTLRSQSGMLSGNTSVTTALHYREPDYETYIFKTTKHTVHSRVYGVVKPVRFNRILNHNLEKVLTKGEKGVYIIKYFNHHNTTDLKSVIKYYLSNSLETDDEIIKSLELELSKYIKSGTTKPLKFRITKFIKESDLLKVGVLKDTLFGGELIIGNPNRLAMMNDHITKTNIEITIEDNVQDVYYLVLGGNVYNVFTGTNNSGETSGNIKVINDGIVIQDQDLNANNLSKNGLFRDKTAALESLDMEKKIELIKLNFEKEKMNNEMNMMKLKREMQLDAHAFDAYKRFLDLELTNSKLNYEKVKLYSSSTSTYLKMGSELGAKILTMFIPVMKIGAK